MFNLDDYYVTLQSQYKDMLSRFPQKDEEFIIRGWCLGQMDSLLTMFRFNIINSSDCDFLFKYLQSILSDLDNNNVSL